MTFLGKTIRGSKKIRKKSSDEYLSLLSKHIIGFKDFILKLKHPELEQLLSEQLKHWRKMTGFKYTDPSTPGSPFYRENDRINDMLNDYEIKRKLTNKIEELINEGRIEIEELPKTWRKIEIKEGIVIPTCVNCGHPIPIFEGYKARSKFCCYECAEQYYKVTIKRKTK